MDTVKQQALKTRDYDDVIHAAKYFFKVYVTVHGDNLLVGDMWKQIVKYFVDMPHTNVYTHAVKVGECMFTKDATVKQVYDLLASHNK